MSLSTSLILVAEILCLIWAYFRSGFMLFPHGFMAYLIGAQTFLILNANDSIHYEFLDFFSTGAYSEYLQQMILLLFAFFVASACCVPSKRFSLRAAFQNIGKDWTVSDGTLFAIIFVLYLRLFLHLYYLDLSNIWANSVYQEMGTIFVREDALGEALLQTSRVFGILAIVLAVSLFSFKRWPLFIAILPIATWHVLFDLAAHSRFAVAYFAISALVLAVLRPGRPIAPTVLMLAAVVALFGSLTGRGSGHHGFSSLPFYLINIVRNDIEYDNLTNIFEGAFVTAEYFAHNDAYNTQYKILSLSPALSFMDGFALIREQYQIRLTRYVPNSAISEILSFGTIYSLVYFSIQFAAGWLSARLLAGRPTPVTVFLNCLVLIAAYLQFTYPVRSMFRLFIIALCASAILLYLEHRRNAGRQAVRAPDRAGQALGSELEPADTPRRRRLRKQAASASIGLGIDGTPSEIDISTPRGRRLARMTGLS